jgi:L-ascorbate peroxidase
MPGGCSWTVNWLTFDNNYFKRIKERRKANKKISDQDSDNQSSESGNATSSIPFNNNHQEIRQDELLWLPTDQALYDAPEFKQFFLMYARHKEVFFVDYAQAHIKFTNLGAKFDPPEGIQL